MIRLEEIEAMDRGALVAAWSDLFGQSAPKSMSQVFLRRFIAQEIQMKRFGGLPKPLQKLVEAEPDKPTRAVGRVQPKAGARLLREWNGVTHIVDVTPDGFRWKGQSYRSLSVIAREITGAHWSGPRFFGLKAKAASA